jgi:hypothetical protein
MTDIPLHRRDLLVAGRKSVHSISASEGDPLAELARVGNYEATGQIVHPSDRDHQSGAIYPAEPSTSCEAAPFSSEHGYINDDSSIHDPPSEEGQIYLANPSRQRRGLTVIAVIVGLALTAGALSYSLWFGRSARIPTDDAVNRQSSDTTGPGSSQRDGSTNSEGALADARKDLTEKLLTTQNSTLSARGDTMGSVPPAVTSPAPGTQSTAEPSQPSALQAAPAGGYIVQLSSQRSETAARATLRTLQTKYANIFRDRQPFVRRSDFGNRGGVYFRAQVGPFAGFSEANQFCGTLKKAGGDCVVIKN